MAGNVAVPLYQQVKEDIKAAIEQGKYKPKEKIPTEPELSAEYSVSHPARHSRRNAPGGGRAVQRRLSCENAGTGNLCQLPKSSPEGSGGKADPGVYPVLRGAGDESGREAS